MNWFQKLFCHHQWMKTYSYASLKDVFASPSGHIDLSGTITVGEACTTCGYDRSKTTIYAKDGSIKKVYIR